MPKDTRKNNLYAKLTLSTNAQNGTGLVMQVLWRGKWRDRKTKFWLPIL